MHYAIRDPSGALFIVLPLPSPSLNAWNGRRWYAKNKIKAAWLSLLALAPGMNSARGLPASTKRAVTISRIAPRALDTDNLYGGCKPIIDAMVTTGLLRDDSPAWMDLVVFQLRPQRGETPHTTITIEERF